MSIISDLYQGKVFPSEDFIPSSPTYMAEDDACQKMYKELSAKLSPEQKEELSHLIDQQNRVTALTLEEMFYYAYALCGKLMFATFTGDAATPE